MNELNGKQFAASTVVRDECGFWIHPELPNFDESTTTEQLELWFEGHGLGHTQVLLTDQMDESEWANDGEIEAVKKWEPKSEMPDSFLVGIWDTEDGIVASFAYPLETK